MHIADNYIIHGQFHADLLVAEISNTWERHAQAFYYFCGIDINKNSQITSRASSKIHGKQLSDEDEYKLARATLVFQHEINHYFQSISTSTGVSFYFLYNLYNDHAQLLAKKLIQNRNWRTTNDIINGPLINDIYSGYLPEDTLIAKSIWERSNMLFNDFNSTTQSHSNFVSNWNYLTDLFDSGYRQKGDDIYFIKLRKSKIDGMLANPGGIILSDLFEGASHYREMTMLLSLPIRHNVMGKLFTESQYGPYTKLFNIIRKFSEDNVAFRLVPRIVSMALQSPLITTFHSQGDDREFDLEDVSPTWRLHRIIELVKKNVFSIDQLLSANGPNDVFDYFGWQNINDQFNLYSKKKHFPGINNSMTFIAEEHKKFCNLSMNSANLIWLDDSYNANTTVNAAITNQFLPPFAKFSDRLIIQRNNCVQLAISVLINLACRDILYEKNFDITRQWIDAFHFSNSPNNLKSKKEFNENWKLVFSDFFGLEWLFN